MFSVDTEFVQMLLKHQSDIRAFVISLLPGCPEIDDVIQDTNLLLCRKKSDYQDGTNFKAWAFSVAVNLAREHRRLMIKNENRVLPLEVFERLEGIWTDTAVEDEPIRRRALDACLSRLSVSERQVVWARYMKGDSLEKHAERTNTTAQSLRVTLFRLRKRLKACVEKRIVMERGHA
ncbi:DNA-directed RNA polymerase sigma-70 factor [Oceaniferula spumae]|uniref:DNA-directed RNA polymerase sigma-70 factor n=1 Tax=Oceaniferula spumae TaxID=2979115 RepID=A0AAT9FGZ5_9BACT